MFASFHPPVHPKTRDRRLISLYRCTPDLKIFCLYSQKTRVLTSLRRNHLIWIICFSHTLELCEQEISYNLDSKKIQQQKTNKQKKQKKNKDTMVFLAISLISKISYRAQAILLQYACQSGCTYVLP